MIPFSQNSFAALNRQCDPSNLQPGQYALGINIRIRNGGPEPIGLPLDLTTTLPTFTKLQGIYGFDNFLVVFADGLAYIKNYDAASPQFTQVPGFQMSTSVSIIYAIEVPASTVNFVRKLATITSGPINLTTQYEGAPSAIICQDGINQPWLILPDGTARVSQTYSQWSQSSGNTREYIPIGTLMLFVNNKTYILVRDTNGNYTLLASSVSGRPCDFMVNIDTNGDAGGTPGYVAYSVSYTPLTCMSATGGSQNQTGGQGVSFYVGHQSFSYLVIPNYNNTIFGEPTYTNQALFSTGPNNNFSIVDLLGDTALTDASGIRSFNSVLQTRFEGRNSPFSKNIQPFFGDINDTNSVIVQTVTAGTEWADYGFFAVQTIYGLGFCIYDTTISNWVSLDLFPNITSPVVMFADIKQTNGIRQLFFMTQDGHFYQYLAGATATAGFYAGDYTPTGQGVDVKPIQENPVFTRVVESGTLSVGVFMDSQLITTLTKPIKCDANVNKGSFNQYPLSLPFGVDADLTRSPSFDLTTFQQGWKMGFWIQWNFKAMLLINQAAGNGVLAQNSMKQQARDYAEYSNLLSPEKNDTI